MTRRRPEGHRHDDLVDQLDGFGTHDRAAEDLAGGGVGDELHESVGFAHHHRFSMIVERVGRHGDGVPRGAGFLLRESDGGDLGIGEDAEQLHPVVDPLHRGVDRAEVDGGVVGGDLALFDRDVDDLVGTADIAGGEDPRHPGALIVSTKDAARAFLEHESRGLRSEGAGIGDTAHRLQDLVGGDLPGPAILLEVDCFPPGVVPLHPGEFRTRVQGEFFASAQGLFESLGDIGIGGGEEVRAALDDIDLPSKALQIAGHLQGDRASAEDDETCRQFRRVEDLVARPVARLLQAGHRQARHHGARGNEAGVEGNRKAIASLQWGDLHRIRTGEDGGAADEIEAPVLELASPVIGEFTDEAFFPGDDFIHACSGLRRAQSEFLRPAYRAGTVRRFDEGFRGHAAAQDAETAEIAGAIDDRDAETEIMGGPCRRVAGAAAAEDEKIVVFFHEMREAGGWNSCWTGRPGHVILSLQSDPPQVAMKSLPRSVVLVCLAGLVFLAACEKPQQRVSAEGERDAPPVETPESAPPAAVAATPVAPVPPVAATDAAGEDAAAPAPAGPDPEPELLVERVGDKIIVAGALRSKIQVERIVETLRREFPDFEIESTLSVDYDRMAVGWGNRVADEFLVPFLQRVENGKVAYRESVVFLDGDVESPGELRMVSEAAITTFSDNTTSDLKNNLKVPASDES